MWTLTVRSALLNSGYAREGAGTRHVGVRIRRELWNSWIKRPFLVAIRLHWAWRGADSRPRGKKAWVLRRSQAPSSLLTSGRRDQREVGNPSTLCRKYSRGRSSNRRSLHYAPAELPVGMTRVEGLLFGRLTTRMDGVGHGCLRRNDTGGSLRCAPVRDNKGVQRLGLELLAVWEETAGDPAQVRSSRCCVLSGGRWRAARWRPAVT
jgi:hypothetical protein